MRSFETCGSGAFLLAPLNEAIARCYEPGREVETYESIDEAVDKILHYLENDTEREAVAAAGHAAAHARHTVTHRALQMLEILRDVGVL